MPPPSQELLTDDYVAEMLANEAKDCSLKYSAMGLEAFNQPAKYVNCMPASAEAHNGSLSTWIPPTTDCV
jgi:hypothetical protein